MIAATTTIVIADALRRTKSEKADFGSGSSGESRP